MASNGECEALAEADKRGNFHTKLSEAFDKLSIGTRASIVGIDKRGVLL